MTLEGLRDVLLWCTIVNYGLVLFWFLIFVAAHDWMYRLHARWFRVSAERFDVVHYGGIAVYKIGILLFNLVPYIGLRIAA